MFLEPVLFGRYPEHAPAAILPPADLILDGDLETIAAPIDFLGVNYYQPQHLRAGDPAQPAAAASTRRCLAPRAAWWSTTREGMEQTTMGWLIDPEGLYELLMRLSQDAPGLPLYITENGCAAEDYVNPDGEVDDLERVKFLHLHLAAAARAARDGASLAGLLRLVAARQLRVGLRLPEAVRHRLTWTSPRSADPEGKLGLLRPGGPRERDTAAARRLAGIRSKHARIYGPDFRRMRARALATSAARPASAPRGAGRPAGSPVRARAPWSGGSPGTRPGPAA